MFFATPIPYRVVKINRTLVLRAVILVAQHHNIILTARVWVGIILDIFGS